MRKIKIISFLLMNVVAFHKNTFAMDLSTNTTTKEEGLLYNIFSVFMDYRKHIDINPAAPLIFQYNGEIKLYDFPTEFTKNIKKDTIEYIKGVFPDADNASRDEMANHFVKGVSDLLFTNKVQDSVAALGDKMKKLSDDDPEKSGVKECLKRLKEVSALCSVLKTTQRLNFQDLFLAIGVMGDMCYDLDAYDYFFKYNIKIDSFKKHFENNNNIKFNKLISKIIEFYLKNIINKAAQVIMEVAVRQKCSIEQYDYFLGDKIKMLDKIIKTVDELRSEEESKEKITKLQRVIFDIKDNFILDVALSFQKNPIDDDFLKFIKPHKIKFTEINVFDFLWKYLQSSPYFINNKKTIEEYLVQKRVKDITKEGGFFPDGKIDLRAFYLLKNNEFKELFNHGANLLKTFNHFNSMVITEKRTPEIGLETAGNATGFGIMLPRKAVKEITTKVFNEIEARFKKLPEEEKAAALKNAVTIKKFYAFLDVESSDIDRWKRLNDNTDKLFKNIEEGKNTYKTQLINTTEKLNKRDQEEQYSQNIESMMGRWGISDDYITNTLGVWKRDMSLLKEVYDICGSESNVDLKNEMNSCLNELIKNIICITTITMLSTDDNFFDRDESALLKEHFKDCLAKELKSSRSNKLFSNFIGPVGEKLKNLFFSSSTGKITQQPPQQPVIANPPVPAGAPPVSQQQTGRGAPAPAGRGAPAPAGSSLAAKSNTLANKIINSKNPLAEVWNSFDVDLNTLTDEIKDFRQNYFKDQSKKLNDLLDQSYRSDVKISLLQVTTSLSDEDYKLKESVKRLEKTDSVNKEEKKDRIKESMLTLAKTERSKHKTIDTSALLKSLSNEREITEKQKAAERKSIHQKLENENNKNQLKKKKIEEILGVSILVEAKKTGTLAKSKATVDAIFKYFDHLGILADRDCLSILEFLPGSDAEPLSDNTAIKITKELNDFVKNATELQSKSPENYQNELAKLKATAESFIKRIIFSEERSSWLKLLTQKGQKSFTTTDKEKSDFKIYDQKIKEQKQKEVKLSTVNVKINSIYMDARNAVLDFLNILFQNANKKTSDELVSEMKKALEDHPEWKNTVLIFFLNENFPSKPQQPTLVQNFKEKFNYQYKALVKYIEGQSIPFIPLVGELARIGSSKIKNKDKIPALKKSAELALYLLKEISDFTRFAHEMIGLSQLTDYQVSTETLYIINIIYQLIHSQGTEFDITQLNADKFNELKEKLDILLNDEIKDISEKTANFTQEGWSLDKILEVHRQNMLQPNVWVTKPKPILETTAAPKLLKLKPTAVTAAIVKTKTNADALKPVTLKTTAVRDHSGDHSGDLFAAEKRFAEIFEKPSAEESSSDEELSAEESSSGEEASAGAEILREEDSSDPKVKTKVKRGSKTSPNFGTPTPIIVEKTVWPTESQAVEPQQGVQPAHNPQPVINLPTTPQNTVQLIGSTLSAERFEKVLRLVQTVEQKDRIVNGLSHLLITLTPDQTRQLDEKLKSGSGQQNPVQNQSNSVPASPVTNDSAQQQSQPNDQKGGSKTFAAFEFLQSLGDLKAENGVVMMAKKCISGIKTLSSVRKSRNELDKLRKKVSPLFQPLRTKKPSKASVDRRTTQQNQWFNSVNAWMNAMNQINESEPVLIIHPTDSLISLELSERKPIIHAFSQLLKNLDQQRKIIAQTDREKKREEARAKRQANQLAQKQESGVKAGKRRLNLVTVG